MKQPFWLLNSTLLFLLCAMLVSLFFLRKSIPPLKKIQPSTYVKPAAKGVAEVNIEKIYKNDLFNTYVPERPQLEKPDYSVAFPPPPQPHTSYIPEIIEPQFLDPLKISLTGIIVIPHDYTRNRIIIADEETKKETINKVGDKIEDAQLIRIFSNKAMFIRSNGQQEILYLREEDAQLDPVYASVEGWDEVLEKNSEKNYTIYIDTFVERIKSLGQLIDELDMISVYKKGKGIGTRIGYLPVNSVGNALGLKKGDIITEINGIAATNTRNRLSIYKSVITLSKNDILTINIIRDGQDAVLTYQLTESNNNQERSKKEAHNVSPPPTEITE